MLQVHVGLPQSEADGFEKYKWLWIIFLFLLPSWGPLDIFVDPDGVTLLRLELSTMPEGNL